VTAAGEPARGVELEAEVPPGIAVAAGTTNGDVEIVGLAGNVHATTTNGQVVYLPAVSSLRPHWSGRRSASSGLRRAAPRCEDSEEDSEHPAMRVSRTSAALGGE
jgi:hypothetical protein